MDLYFYDLKNTPSRLRQHMYITYSICIDALIKSFQGFFKYRMLLNLILPTKKKNIKSFLFKLKNIKIFSRIFLLHHCALFKLLHLDSYKPNKKKGEKMSYLDEFKKHTVVVCDTGDFEGLQLYFIFN
jgi:hypothetical protein